MPSIDHIRSINRKFAILATPSSLKDTDMVDIYVQYAALLSDKLPIFSTQQQLFASILSKKIEFNEYTENNVKDTQFQPFKLFQEPEIDTKVYPVISQEIEPFVMNPPLIPKVEHIDNSLLAQNFLDEFAAQKDDSGLQKALRLDFQLLEDIFCEFVE